jgi:uncharacterized protein YukE
MRSIQGRTDFSRFNHRQLQSMLYSGKTTTLRAAAEWWDAVGARLHGQAGNLERQLDGFQHRWRGGAANQYQVMITDLSGGLRTLADTAYAMRDLANDEADALTAAQRAMPPPVDVPDLPAETLRLATLPIELDPAATPDTVARVRRQQADATAMVRYNQQATKASNAAHAEAIRVMNQLAERYVLAYESTPVTPSGRLTATSPDGPNPLFGNMFTAGLAAASAASAGRFGELPQVPAFAAPGSSAPPPASSEASLPSVDDVVDPADAGSEIGAGAGFGGGGGGGGGIGGVGGIDVPAAPPPTAHSGMVAGPGVAAGLAAGALGVAAGAAAGVGTGMTPMMPMMPMHPMNHGGDSAAARRVPPWLVETENVWGESAAIIPSVIGEEPSTDDEPIF